MNFIAATFITLLLIIQKSCCTCLVRRACAGGESVFSSPSDSTSSLNGDLQLLIPAWRFSSMGYVSVWQAIVQGSALSNSIEFQIFRPAQNAAGVYELVYGNALNANCGTQSGNTASLIVELACNPPEIPVRPDDIVGIRMKNNTPGFGLQYSGNTTAGVGVDVYYWQGLGSQASSLSICDSNVGVMRGIIPLVSWIFCFVSTNIVETVFQQQLQSGLINPLTPSQSNPPSCPTNQSQPPLTTTQTVPLSPNTTVQNAGTLLTTLIVSSSLKTATLGIDTIDTSTTETPSLSISLTAPSTTAWIASTPLPTETINFSSLPSSSLTTASVITTTHSSDTPLLPTQAVTARMPIYSIIIISLAVMCAVIIVVAMISMFIILCKKLKKKDRKVECGSDTGSPIQGRLCTDLAHTSAPEIAYDYPNNFVLSCNSLITEQANQSPNNSAPNILMNDNTAYGAVHRDDQDNEELITNVTYGVTVSLNDRLFTITNFNY